MHPCIEYIKWWPPIMHPYIYSLLAHTFRRLIFIKIGFLSAPPHFMFGIIFFFLRQMFQGENLLYVIVTFRCKVKFYISK